MGLYRQRIRHYGITHSLVTGGVFHEAEITTGILDQLPVAI